MPFTFHSEGACESLKESEKCMEYSNVKDINLPVSTFVIFYVLFCCIDSQ